MNEAPLVLVADDDEDIVALVRLRLERAGLAVVVARDGESELAAARERRPRVAVLDVSMPGLDGLEVVRRLRADEATRGTGLILLTANAQEADVQRGFDAGADVYLKKPFSPAELAARVEGLLQDSGGR
ncbi:MAG: response regulator [Actinobacteria bacterium]|nr:MAG: response regulator [Actinomycetota bacterium]